ncbi:MAG: hypothetical protein K2O03_14585 [Lachnospiraceae bacterium]|nr:hypothetical protein [Lachnospiraceae bacterium]
MKSDEEFIAGIYQKAEERKMEEEKAAQSLKNTGRRHNFRAWRALAAAACLCLIVSGAVYANGRSKQQEEDSPARQGELSGENAVMALSLGESEVSAGDAAPEDDVNPRGRIAPGEENGEAPGSVGFRSGENAVVGALRAGVSSANLAGYPNPAGEEDGNISSGEDSGDILPQEGGAGILPGEDGADTAQAGGN